MDAMEHRAALQQAAGEVIDILRNMTEFSETRIAVIGGLALWNYLPEGRTTQDVDFIVNASDAPQGVKQRLLNLPGSPFVQHAQMFYYVMGTGQHVQVDITPYDQSPYMPEAATRVRDIPPGVVPYISATDVVVFKIFSCGLRAQQSKKRTDAVDASDLLGHMTENSPLTLTSIQRQFVEEGIMDVVTQSDWPEAWWRERLGMSTE